MESKRLTEIETKLAFQEKIIEELNQIIYNQQKQIDLMTKQIKAMEDKIITPSQVDPEFNPIDEIPPHY